MNFENIQLAPLTRRGLAFFIDELLLSVLIVIIYYDTILGASSPEEAVMATSAVVLPYIIIRFIYHAFFTYKYGASLGKQAVKIKVVDYSGNTPNLNTSFMRSGMRVFSEAVFHLGFIWAFLDRKRQTWHDKVAKTLVVSFD